MIEPIVVYFSLILARVGTFVAVMPLFADRAPRLVRAGLALALSIFYFSAVGPNWDLSMSAKAHASGVPFFLALAREALIGAMMGFAFSLFLLPAQIAGTFVAGQIGLASGPLPGPAGQTATGPIALAFEVFAALVFFEINGHHVLLGALHASFARFPLGGTLVPQPIGPMVDGMTRAHELGVMLASPLAFCLLALTIVLAFAGRIAPQLSIHTVGFTLQSVVSLVGFAFLLPDVFRLLASFTARGGETVSRFMG